MICFKIIQYKYVDETNKIGPQLIIVEAGWWVFISLLFYMLESFHNEKLSKQKRLREQ